MRAEPAGLVLVVVAALWAHGLSLRSDFVYDDHRFVVNNVRLGQASLAELVLEPATQTADGDRDVWRPLRALGHRFDLSRWGPSPFGFHLHSVLVHVLNSVLALLVLRRLLPAPAETPALLGALALAAHPLGVEAAGWVSSRGDLYAVLFGLPALLLAVGPAREPQRHLVARAVGAAVLTFLASLGKESAAVLPLIALVVGRLADRRWWAGTLAAAAGAAAALVLRQVALQGESPVQTTPHGGDLVVQAGWALFGTGRMLQHLVWPVGLSIDYPQLSWSQAALVWLSPSTLLGLAAVAAACVLPRTVRRTAAAALAWMLLAYLPSSSLLVTLRSLLADRYAYPVLVPFGVLLGSLLLGRSRGTLVVATGLLLVLWLPLSVARTGVFRDDTSLWTDALASHPGSVRARFGLASVALGRGDTERAGAELRAAASAAPAGSAQRGMALARLGDFVLRRERAPEEALSLLAESLLLQRQHRDRDRPGPDEASTAAALAEALAHLRRFDEADALLAEEAAAAQGPARAGLLIERALLRWTRARGSTDPKLWNALAQAYGEARAAAPGHPVLEELEQALAAEPAPRLETPSGAPDQPPPAGFSPAPEPEVPPPAP